MAIYKDDRTNTWYCQFRYRDWQGNSRATTKRGFKTKRDAKAYEAEYKRDALQPAHLTIGQLAEAWLKALELRKIKPNTMRSYNNQLRLHILPCFANKRADKLAPADLLNWQAELERSGLAPHSILTANRCFVAMLNHAVSVYGLPSNPFNKIYKTGKQAVRQTVWTIDEFNKALAYCNSEYHRLIFKMLFYGGFRIGELLALTESDLNFADNTISITKSYDDRFKQSNTPKTVAGNRTITMPSVVMTELRQYLDRLPVIPERPLGVYEATGMARRLSVMATQASLPRLTLHGLRHSHASLLIANNVSLPAIARRLGHKDAGVTLSVYSHFYKTDDKEIAKLFDDFAK